MTSPRRHHGEQRGVGEVEEHQQQDILQRNSR
jgi:hypothetical protein